MPVTQLGAVPVNQLNALPLISAQAAANGGTLTINPNGGVTRFFDSATLGISGANFAIDANGFIVLVSSFISVFGCRTFTVILTRTNAGLGIALAGIDVRVQYRLSATDVPPTSLGAAQTTDFTGSSSVNTALVVFPAMQAGGEVQRRLITWDPGNLVGVAGSPAMIGDNVRLFFNINGGANPGVANLFSAQLWASS